MTLRNQIRRDLLAGFGIYDIALRLQIRPCYVRVHVKFLRENGTLAFWWLV